MRDRHGQERPGDWMQTYRGRSFWPLDPRPEEIFLDDLAHHLSMITRYAGACLNFYSVAEHSILITDWLAQNGFADDKEVLRWALLHDAAEGLGLGDVIRPVKRFSPEYKRLELGIMERGVIPRFGLSIAYPACVDIADRRILCDEQAQNMATPDDRWGAIEGLKPLGVALKCWEPKKAEVMFLEMAGALGLS